MSMRNSVEACPILCYLTLYNVGRIIVNIITHSEASVQRVLLAGTMKRMHESSAPASFGALIFWVGCIFEVGRPCLTQSGSSGIAIVLPYCCCWLRWRY